jgi:DNA-binding transcriptional ArsR family regulator
VEPFAPDALTLELLQSEHTNGTWVGHELLPIASRIRNQGGDADDYERWVLSSYLWSSYTNSTSDRAKKQDASLAGAWLKAKDSKPFDLETALTELGARVSAHTGWTGPTGSRNRAVALALIGFCIEHNCFTRTLSSYELAKRTSGMSQRTVSRALTALTDIGLIREVERTDRRTSTRSTRRYQLSLRWGVSKTDSRSTGKASLSHELTPPLICGPAGVWGRVPSGFTRF